MKSYVYDESKGKLYIIEDGSIAILDRLSTGTLHSPAAKTRQRKWHKANKHGAQLQKEIIAHHGQQRRQHPETSRIEEMLVAGESVPAILEKVEVSPPTVYLIKTRLRKEGKIA